MNRIYLLIAIGFLTTHLLLGQTKPNATKSLSPAVLPTADQQGKDTVRFEVEPLKINTEYAEIAPMFYKQNFLYTLIKSKKNFLHENLRWYKYPEIVPCIIQHPDSTAQGKIILTATSETWHFNTGIAAPIPNTEKIIITRSLHKKMSFKDFFSKAAPERLGLFEANTNGDVWFNLQPVFPLDTLDYSEAHPTLSEDGKTLYFVSDRAGGYGGTDIYVTHRDENGNWSKPINLGDKINTADNELYPFVHSDKNLYFASNRKGGFGGYDIYEAIWDGEQFAKVINMGIPTNSNKDDISFIVNEPKRICYFSSNRDGGEGSFDIYKMNVKLLNISRNFNW
ncbi:MAG: TolB family protein [Thermoflexibacteraceae bacterium]